MSGKNLMDIFDAFERANDTIVESQSILRSPEADLTNNEKEALERKISFCQLMAERAKNLLQG